MYISVQDVIYQYHKGYVIVPRTQHVLLANMGHKLHCSVVAQIQLS